MSRCVKCRFSLINLCEKCVYLYNLTYVRENLPLTRHKSCFSTSDTDWGNSQVCTQYIFINFNPFTTIIHLIFDNDDTYLCMRLFKSHFTKIYTQHTKWLDIFYLPTRCPLSFTWTSFIRFLGWEIWKKNWFYLSTYETQEKNI